MTTFCTWEHWFLVFLFFNLDIKKNSITGQCTMTQQVWDRVLKVSTALSTTMNLYLDLDIKPFNLSFCVHNDIHLKPKFGATLFLWCMYTNTHVCYSWTSYDIPFNFVARGRYSNIPVTFGGCSSFVCSGFPRDHLPSGFWDPCAPAENFAVRFHPRVPLPVLLMLSSHLKSDLK